MTTLVLALMALFGLATAAGAEDQVKDDSTWSGGGVTVTVDIVANPTVNTVSVTFTDSNGTSPAATGTPGSSSTSSDPTCTTSGNSQTPGSSGGNYRVQNGRVQRKNSAGDWVNMRKKIKAGGSGGSYYLQAGSPAPHAGTLVSLRGRSVWLDRGAPAPWSGQLFTNGEEGTSLPH